jgi:hypothetical protein
LALWWESSGKESEHNERKGTVNAVLRHKNMYIFGEFQFEIELCVQSSDWKVLAFFFVVKKRLRFCSEITDSAFS